MSDPIPLELEYPGLAKQFELIANRLHPTIRAINIDPIGSLVFLKNKSFKRVNVIEPNEPCFCGSTRKFKKCCANKTSTPLICVHCHKEVKVIKNINDTSICRCYDPKPMVSKPEGDPIVEYEGLPED